MDSNCLSPAQYKCWVPEYLVIVHIPEELNIPLPSNQLTFHGEIYYQEDQLKKMKEKLYDKHIRKWQHGKYCFQAHEYYFCHDGKPVNGNWDAAKVFKEFANDVSVISYSGGYAIKSLDFTLQRKKKYESEIAEEKTSAISQEEPKPEFNKPATISNQPQEEPKPESTMANCNKSTVNDGFTIIDTHKMY